MYIILNILWYIIVKHDVNVIYIILFCGTLGALASLHDKKTGKEHM